NAKNASITIKGKPVTVETVTPARLGGLDEIHVLVPPELSGAGASTVIVTADGVQSNPVSVSIGGIAPTPTPTPTPSPSPSPLPSPESSPQIVISQIFGRGSSAVTLTGWSVQYASATASTWSATPLTSVTVNPGQYYLIQESSG